MRLHKVNDRLYRSDQPAIDELGDLRERGVSTIISLRREERALMMLERERAQALGMRFFHFPFYGIFGASSSLLDAILAEVSRPENGVVLVHCKNGRDRTSLVVGLYRALMEGAPVDEVWASDFVAFGHDPENPAPEWASPVTLYFYQSIRRTFLRHVRLRKGF
jgi:protein tyrosine/serine phosphatase